ncbi:MAG: hypothetical protein ABSA12_05600 [Verrucomicrobiia bacterium]
MKSAFQYLMVLTVCPLCWGCQAFTRPVVAERSFDQYRVGSQPYALGIERAAPTNELFITGDELIAEARRLKLFKNVDYVDEMPAEPAFVLKDFTFSENRRVCEPMVFVLTLGVIPQPCSVGHYISYTIISPDQVDLCHVNSYQGSTVLLGWVSGLVRYMHGWSPDEDKATYADGVLLEIVKKLADGQYIVVTAQGRQ